MRLGRRGRSDPAAPRAASDEVASLTIRNKSTRDAEVEERLLRLRHEAYFDLHAAPRAVWPPVFSDPFPGVEGRPPEITSAELTAEVAGGAIQHHGCLLVRGLLSPERVARLVDDTDRAFRAREDALDGAPVSRTRPWYVPFEPGPGSPPLVDSQREWVRDCGAYRWRYSRRVRPGPSAPSCGVRARSLGEGRADPGAPGNPSRRGPPLSPFPGSK
jgi:hypothetical protein